MLLKSEKLGKVPGVYGIKNEEGIMLYVGSSLDLGDAFSRHKSNLKNGKYYGTNKAIMQQFDTLYFKVLEYTYSTIAWETKYINMYKDTICNSDKVGKKRSSVSTIEETAKRRQANLGSKNPHNTKLNIIDVFNIKIALAKGTSNTELAKKYGVSNGFISNIKHNRRWASVSVPIGLLAGDNVSITG